MTDKQVKVTLNLTVIAVAITIIGTVGGVVWKASADRADVSKRIEGNDRRITANERMLSQHEETLKRQQDLMSRIDENVKWIKEQMRKP